MKYIYKDLSVKDTSRLEQAKRVAAVSDCNQKHGAVGVKGGRALGVGVNYTRNSQDVFDSIPMDARSVHAEEALLRAMGPNAKGATVYVARVNKAGAERLSKPCARCTILLKQAGVRAVIFTVDSSLVLD